MPVLTFGATPVFCDVDPMSLNIDPDDIARKVNSRTKAIVVAHLLGQPCNMGAVNDVAKKAGIPVIEDAAHAFGSIYSGQKIGRTADICVFSFSRKALSLSEGGAVVTDRYDLFERVLALVIQSVLIAVRLTPLSCSGLRMFRSAESRLGCM